jgi:leucyl-tRNA synthetase
MELLNALNKFEDASEQGRAVMGEALTAMVKMLAPMTPHISHELWKALGQDSLLLDAAWPMVDEAALKRDVIDLMLQVNGKLRGQFQVSADATKAQIEAAALADEQAVKFVEGQTLVKVIVVPGRLVNLVVK